MTSSRRPQRNTTDGETDGGLNKDGTRKQNHDNRGVSETGDRQQSTQPQGNKRRRSKPRHTSRRRLPRGKDNHQATKTPEEQERKEGSRTETTLRHRTRTTRGRAPLATEKPTDQPWREGRNSLPVENGSSEDSATDRKGEPRGDQKPKRRKARRATPPRTDRRDGEEKENGLDHNQEETDEQKGDGGAPPKGTEDPTYYDTRFLTTRQDQ